MNKEEVMKRMHGIGIIPAIALNRVEDAAPLPRHCVLAAFRWRKSPIVPQLRTMQ